MKNSLTVEETVCTLEQAKELARLLGEHAPESLWCWVWGKWGAFETNPTWGLTLGDPINPSTKFYPAYTGDELGVLLPKFVTLETHECRFDLWAINDGFACCYDRVEDDCPLTAIFDKPYEVRAKADLAIQGLTEGWIKPEEFNYET